PIPGVAAKVVDQETGEPVVGRDGLLLVKGPNLMDGYLGREEDTRAAMRDGWYVTGDIARIDEDGFMFLVDRLSRFSKIAGEMVPHVRIEDAIEELTSGHAAVTTVSDEVKGERLVAFYTDAAIEPAEVWERLCRTELPRLWLPRRDDIHRIEAIPTLGSGKTDLRAVRQLALARTEAAA